MAAFLALARAGFHAAAQREDKCTRALSAAADWLFAAAIAAFVIRPSVFLWIAGEGGFAFALSRLGGGALIGGLIAAGLAETRRHAARKALS